MNKTSLITLLFLAICHLGCNPECEPVAGLRVEPPVGITGDQVLLKATPLSALNDKSLQVYFNSRKADIVDFHPELGLIVRIPQGVSGQSELRVTNPDCEEVLDFNAVQEDFFRTSKDYISPAVPEIYFPTLALPPFPPTLENAWLHPVSKDYCLWFKFLKDSNGNCTSAIDQLNSFEQSTCGRTDVYYAKNPMFGTVDTLNNIIHFWIDRRNTPFGNLGIEEYEGRFINISETNYATWENDDCFAGKPFWQERFHMMWVTSRKTGRQLLVYQQAFADPTFEVECHN